MQRIHTYRKRKIKKIKELYQLRHQQKSYIEYRDISQFGVTSHDVLNTVINYNIGCGCIILMTLYDLFLCEKVSQTF